MPSRYYTYERDIDRFRPLIDVNGKRYSGKASRTKGEAFENLKILVRRLFKNCKITRARAKQIIADSRAATFEISSQQPPTTSTEQI